MLPAVSPIRTAEGCWMHNKDAAKASACVEAIRLLHQVGVVMIAYTCAFCATLCFACHIPFDMVVLKSTPGTPVDCWTYVDQLVDHLVPPGEVSG